MTHNEKVLPMVGDLKNLRQATEVQYCLQVEDKNKKPNSKRPARPKADSDMTRPEKSCLVSEDNPDIGC